MSGPCPSKLVGPVGRRSQSSRHSLALAGTDAREGLDVCHCQLHGRRAAGGESLRASDADVLGMKLCEARLPEADRNPPYSDMGAGGSRSRFHDHYSSAASPHGPTRPLADSISSAKAPNILQQLVKAAENIPRLLPLAGRKMWQQISDGPKPYLQSFADQVVPVETILGSDQHPQRPETESAPRRQMEYGQRIVGSKE